MGQSAKKVMMRTDRGGMVRVCAGGALWGFFFGGTRGQGEMAGTPNRESANGVLIYRSNDRLSRTRSSAPVNLNRVGGL